MKIIRDASSLDIQDPLNTIKSVYTVPDAVNVSVAVPAAVDGVHHLPDRPDPGEQEHDGDETRVTEWPHFPHEIRYKFKLQVR